MTIRMNTMLAGCAALSLIATAAQPAPALAATVEVRVNDVASGRGFVMVALCNEASFLKDCPYKKRVAATRGVVIVRFEKVPPGLYAAMAFHDENANGQIDRSKLGVPVESAGFSRDAVGHNGPPAFKDAAVAVPAKGAVIDVNLVDI